jgi:hypothetical protein
VPYFLPDMDEKPHLELIRLLLARLERISPDSYWAHQASGLRGSLLKVQEMLEKGRLGQRSKSQRLIANGFRILEEAAREKRRSKGNRG